MLSKEKPNVVKIDGKNGLRLYRDAEVLRRG